MNEEVPAFSVVVLSLPQLINKTNIWVSRTREYKVIWELGVKDNKRDCNIVLLPWLRKDNQSDRLRPFLLRRREQQRRYGCQFQSEWCCCYCYWNWNCCR